MASKARFHSQSGVSAATPTGGKSKAHGVSSTNSGQNSKRGVTNANVLASALTTGPPARSGAVQVIFNGKIVTPQSLLIRKSGPSDRSKKHKQPSLMMNKQQTIDEAASESQDRASTGFASKMNLKRGLESDNRLQSKFGSMLKQKAVVEETFNVTLCETQTTILLALPSFITPSDTRDVIVHEERNARYEALVKSHVNIDSFANHATQTKNNPLKNQNDLAAPNAVRDFGSQAISYEIKDEIATLHRDANHDSDLSAALISHNKDAATHASGGTQTDLGDDEQLTGMRGSIKKFILDTVGVALVTPGCLLDTTHATKPPAPGDHAHHKDGGLKSKSKGKSTATNKFNSAMSFGVSDNPVSGDETSGMTSGFLNPEVNVPKKAVSTASSGGESGQDVVNVAGSKANVSQSKETSDSEDNSHRGHAETFTEEDSLQILREHEIKKILSSAMLLKRMQMIERAIQQNANYRNQLDYRDLPDISTLQLVSPDRLKSADNNDNQYNKGAFGGFGKGKFSKGASTRSNTLGALGHMDSNAHFSDTASVHSADDSDSRSAAGDKSKPKIDAALLLGDGNKIKKLFTYANPALIEGRMVTAMAWNTVSSDLLAVGYGRFTDIKKANSSSSSEPTTATNTANNTSHNANANNAANSEAKDGEGAASSQGSGSEASQEGLVLFWSLRNPDYPEKILRTSHSVTALDFSAQHPMILAVGLANGDVNVYDVKREGATWAVPVESSAGMTGSHLDPVWQLKWIVRGVERQETLVSISTDGRVLEWNLKKGLVMSTLMHLKKSGTGEGWITNNSAGLSFDFHPDDPSTYVTGTEDGSLHRCSISYNEQYLETYAPHTAPVYAVRFSKRWPNVFLSCSADWSMNLYHLSRQEPLLTMRATSDTFPVNDVAWCLDNATVFACVTADAKLQIWDLSQSAIDPVVSVDMGAEDVKAAETKEAAPEEGLNEGSVTSNPAVGATGAQSTLAASRYISTPLNATNAATEDDHATPMQRLLKNLGVDGKKRILTTVLFGEKNPIVAVGDNRGQVTVYRVFDPPTITHLGPLQQFQKLKAAVLSQTDPNVAAMFQNETGNFGAPLAQQASGNATNSKPVEMK